MAVLKEKRNFFFLLLLIKRIKCNKKTEGEENIKAKRTTTRDCLPWPSCIALDVEGSNENKRAGYLVERGAPYVFLCYWYYTRAQ